MKWNILSRIIPDHLCDVFGAGSFLGSAVSTAGEIYTNERNISEEKKENQRNRDWQSEENQRSRDFSSEEAEKQRNWSSDEWQRQFNAQRDEWYNQLQAQYGAQWDQFLRESEYNSPQNQVQRLSEAGLNPSAVLGANLGGLVSASRGSIPSSSPSVPTGGTVSGASASASTGSPSTGSVGLANNPFRMSDFGSLVRDLADAAKTNKTLEPYLNNLLADTQLKLSQAGLQESLKETQDVTNYILSKTKNTKVKQATADYVLTLADIAVKASQGKLYDQQALFYAQETYLSKVKRKLSKVELAEARVRLSFATQRQQAELDNLVSSTGKNRADAALSISQKLSEDRFRELRAQAIGIHNHLEATEAVTLTRESSARVEKLITEMVYQGVLTDAAAEEVRKLKNENGVFKSRELRRWLETAIYGASAVMPSGGSIPIPLLK